ncbi:segregation/condensation protein A [Oscillospiraceae bacterium PP1C4]
MERLSFKTAEFEGPLDLMLFLISKHKLDICDICISDLLEQYMDYINLLKSSNLEVASEFLEMASRLVYIKTVMLLPKHEEEGLQLKAELQGQLLEYRVCKLVAAELQRQNRMNLTFVRTPMKIQTDNTYRLTHPARDLYNAYQNAVGRGKRRLPPPAQAFSEIVSRRVVSVGSRVIFVLKHLYRRGKASYDSLFETSADRSELVATFLAVLELVRAKRISIHGEQVRFHRIKHGKQQPEETDL